MMQCLPRAKSKECVFILFGVSVLGFSSTGKIMYYWTGQHMYHWTIEPCHFLYFRGYLGKNCQKSHSASFVLVHPEKMSGTLLATNTANHCISHRIHVLHIYLHLVDVYGFHVGKYTIVPWISWVLLHLVYAVHAHISINWFHRSIPTGKVTQLTTWDGAESLKIMG